MIKSITLNNFRSFVGKHTITFTEGINVILAKNGTGKTTILEAISLALFDDSTNTLKNSISVGHSSGSIAVHLDDIKVFRQFGETSAYEITSDGKWIAKGKEDCVRYLKQYLGVPADVVYLRQTQLASVLTLSPAIRKNFFDSLFGVEMYTNIKNLLREAKNILADQIHDLEIHKARLEGSIRPVGDISSLQQEHMRINEELAQHASIPQDAIKLAARKEQLIAYIANNKKRITNASPVSQEEYDRAVTVYPTIVIALEEEICPTCHSTTYDSEQLLIDKSRTETIISSPPIANVQANIDQATAELAKIIAALGDDYGKTEELQTRLVKLNYEIAHAIETDENNKEAKKVLKLLDSELTILTGKRDKAIKLQKAAAQLGGLVAEMYREEIAVEASTLLASVLPLHIEEWAADYSLKVSGLGFTSLSQAQRDITAMCLRLAIASYISPLSFIMIDEPFASLDANNVQASIEMVESVSFPQAIIVTHDESLHGNNIIHLIKDSKGHIQCI